MNIINNTDDISKEIITNLTNICVNNINQINAGYIPSSKSNCIINCLNIVSNAIRVNAILDDIQQQNIINIYHNLMYADN